MFEHSTYIIAAYIAATVVLAWCALAPIFRRRRVIIELRRILSRSDKGGAS